MSISRRLASRRGRSRVSLIDGGDAVADSPTRHIALWRHPRGLVRIAAWRPPRAPRRTPSNSPGSPRADLPFCRAFGVFLEGWATAARRRGRRRARTCAAASSSARTERSVFRGLLRSRWRGRSPGGRSRPRPCDPTKRWRRGPHGYRAFEAELHRPRGEILLNRDPADPAPAEEPSRPPSHREAASHAQLRTRAASALAKLYQSTGRPADAHAVLAPALEGFSPTPEDA